MTFSLILAKHRAGQPITLEDKLASITSEEELNGFLGQMGAGDRLLTDREMMHVARRRHELRREAQ